MATQNWQIAKITFRVSDFISWQRAKSLVLNPSFQRRPVWKPGAKSFFIDTVIRGLPIPIIFIREKRTDLTSLEPRREVVDGQQRIRTLFSFIDPNLLEDYNPKTDLFFIKKSHNLELANKKFSDLPPEVRSRILDYEFSVHVLPSAMDDRDVVSIFARMNATGVQLNPQEIRNAHFYGELRTSVYEMATAQLERWRKWEIFNEYDIARMQEAEIVSEFVLLMYKGLTGKTQRALDKLYADNEENFPERTEVERRFHLVMDTINDHFGTDILSLPFHRKTLFYSMFAFLYDIQFGLKSPLSRRKADPVSAETLSWVKTAGRKIQEETAPKAVLDAAARRTTNPDSRHNIHEYLNREF